MPQESMASRQADGFPLLPARQQPAPRYHMQQDVSFRHTKAASVKIVVICLSCGTSWSIRSLCGYLKSGVSTMKKSFYTALLAGVVMPFAAFAQDTNPAAPAETPPAASDTAMPSDSTDAAAPSGTLVPEEDATADTAAPTDMDTAEGEAGKTDKPAGMASDAPADGDMDTASASAEGPFVTVPPTGAWRVADLDGKDVYDTAGESIGSISDVLVSEDGEVMAVLVGVGGFLGIGQKDVAVSMSALEFGPGKTEGLPTEAEVNAQASAAAPAAGGTGMAADPAAGGTGMAAGDADMSTASTTATAEPVTPVVGEDNLPDRIVLNVTREQLEQAPAYGEPEEMADDTDGVADPAMAPAGEAAPAAQ
ncbi:PRC-barrel domain-containing protein [Aurantimonas sp. A2-1-M11]|uniref:PRC-barrel domain-containing protein n=1 Tax=Aurantimonas sp. A2-1-M11 TaxID=3113712 RepID=UPI002F933FB6